MMSEYIQNYSAIYNIMTSIPYDKGNHEHSSINKMERAYNQEHLVVDLSQSPCLQDPKW